MRFLAILFLLAGCSSEQSRVIAEARSFPDGQALLIGDSIAAAHSGTTLCGLRLFNGAIGGTGAEEWTGIAPDLVAELAPALLVVSLGIVDARRHVNPEQWERDYRRIAASAENIVLVSLAPVDHARIAERPIPDHLIADLNRRIAAIGAEHGARVVPPLARPMTSDGIHLSSDGQAQWARNLEAACARSP